MNRYTLYTPQGNGHAGNGHSDNGRFDPAFAERLQFNRQKLVRLGSSSNTGIQVAQRKAADDFITKLPTERKMLLAAAEGNEERMLNVLGELVSAENKPPENVQKHHVLPAATERLVNEAVAAAVMVGMMPKPSSWSK